MNKEILAKLGGEFTWSFNRFFHIETSQGCFEWSDPEYGGDNSIRRTVKYEDWIKQHKIPYGRDKGFHIIENYVGTDFTYVES